MSKTNEKQRKKCVTLAKRIAVRSAGGSCEHCGRSKLMGYVMHGSHVYPEGRYKGMSADSDNILCLCFQCHFLWWHKHPLEASEWFREKWPDRAETLKLRAREIRIINWNDKHEALKAEEAKLP